MVEWSMEFEELSTEKRSTTTTTDRRSRKRKRSKSPGVVNNSGSAKKSQNEPFESFPKLNSFGNNGEEGNGLVNKSIANGRRKTGNEMDKLPVIQENGKAGNKLLNLKKNSGGAKHGSTGGEDTDLSPELLILPHVKPVQNSKVAKPPRKNVWD